MSDLSTTKLSEYVEQLGINIADLARKTGIPDGILRHSIVRRERSLRAEEYMIICNFIGKDPSEFYVPPKDKSS